VPGSSQTRAAAAALVAGLLLAAAADGALAVSGITVSVEATANLWAAGQAGPIEDGTLPAEIVVPEGETIASFPHVSGSWSNTGGPMFSADGERPAVGTAYDCGGPPPCTVMASNGLSGLSDAARFWYLTGVFLGPGTPGGTSPASVDFTDRHELTVLEPALDQVFFIGDGRTSDGVVQQFLVPPGAARLFLGMVDILEPGRAAGWYIDNHGSLEVTASWLRLRLYRGPGILDTWLLLAVVGAIAFLTVVRARGSRLDSRPTGWRERSAASAGRHTGPDGWGQAEILEGPERKIAAREASTGPDRAPSDRDHDELGQPDGREADKDVHEPEVDVVLGRRARPPDSARRSPR
jgi:hypothetical protein